MTNVAHLRLVDGNGELVEDDLTAENKALRAALTRAENTIKGLRSQLVDSRSAARRQYPIDEVFADWQAKMVAAGLKGKARCKLSADRVDAMTRAFEAGYTLGDFRAVNTALAAYQFVVYGKRRAHGSDDARDVDLEPVCSRARRFEECARLGYVLERERGETAA